MKNAVILLSGGLDSATCMGMAKKQNFELYPISFDYHQRHNIELKSAKKIADYFNVKKHLIIETNMEKIGGSALTDKNISVPKGVLNHNENDVPITYVPARNLIFLSYALAYAETINANHIFIGVNAIDYSGYPDCRPEFIEKFQSLADVGTKATAAEHKRIKIETPLQNLSKKEIILLAKELNVPLEFTHSCYAGYEKACGVCESCKIRLNAFKEAGIEDPIEYITRE